MNKHRIELLDSFRCIAIVAVLLYHLTNSYIAQYPYGNYFQHIFKYGYLGVQFFFMISGFVISYTLENTPSLLSFYKNRFIRLFPAVLLCSLITFTVSRALDGRNLFGNAHQIKNFLPSLTFINPNLWKLITGIDFHWINGSYWSLWVEVQFYAIASAAYFISKKNFFRNMLLVGIAVAIAKYIQINLIGNHTAYLKLHGLLPIFVSWQYGNELFNITFYITWFLPGVFFYHLYKGIDIRKYPFTGVCGIILLFYLVRDTWVFF